MYRKASGATCQIRCRWSWWALVADAIRTRSGGGPATDRRRGIVDACDRLQGRQLLSPAGLPAAIYQRGADRRNWPVLLGLNHMRVNPPKIKANLEKSECFIHHSEAYYFVALTIGCQCNYCISRRRSTPEGESSLLPICQTLTRGPETSSRVIQPKPCSPP